jgi:propionyl-CoA synthetase
VGYRDLFEVSINDPTTFWAEAATAVTRTTAPERIFDDSHPPFYRWFPTSSSTPAPTRWTVRR